MGRAGFAPTLCPHPPDAGGRRWVSSLVLNTRPALGSLGPCPWWALHAGPSHVLLVPPGRLTRSGGHRHLTWAHQEAAPCPERAPTCENRTAVRPQQKDNRDEGTPPRRRGVRSCSGAAGTEHGTRSRPAHRLSTRPRRTTPDLAAGDPADLLGPCAAVGCCRRRGGPGRGHLAHYGGGVQRSGCDRATGVGAARGALPGAVAGGEIGRAQCREGGWGRVGAGWR